MFERIEISIKKRTSNTTIRRRASFKYPKLPSPAIKTSMPNNISFIQPNNTDRVEPSCIRKAKRVVLKEKLSKRARLKNIALLFRDLTLASQNLNKTNALMHTYTPRLGLEILVIGEKESPTLIKRGSVIHVFSNDKLKNKKTSREHKLYKTIRKFLQL